MNAHSGKAKAEEMSSVATEAFRKGFRYGMLLGLTVGVAMALGSWFMR